jgi:hypothetical protein
MQLHRPSIQRHGRLQQRLAAARQAAQQHAQLVVQLRGSLRPAAAATSSCQPLAAALAHQGVQRCGQGGAAGRRVSRRALAGASQLAAERDHVRSASAPTWRQPPTRDGQRAQIGSVALQHLRRRVHRPLPVAQRHQQAHTLQQQGLRTAASASLQQGRARDERGTVLLCWC